MKAEFTRSRFGDCGSCGASSQYCAICFDNSQHDLDKRIDDELTKLERAYDRLNSPEVQEAIECDRIERELIKKGRPFEVLYVSGEYLMCVYDSPKSIVYSIKESSKSKLEVYRKAKAWLDGKGE